MLLKVICTVVNLVFDEVTIVLISDWEQLDEATANVLLVAIFIGFVCIFGGLESDNSLTSSLSICIFPNLN